MQHDCIQDKTIDTLTRTLEKHDETIGVIKELTIELRESNIYSKDFLKEIKEHIKEQVEQNKQTERRIGILEFEMKTVKKSQESTEVQVKDILDSNTIRTDKEITGGIKKWLPTGILFALALALFGLLYAVQGYMTKVMELLKK
jgi:hypothetical protein